MGFETSWSENGELGKPKKFIPIEEIPDPKSTEEGLRLRNIEEEQENLELTEESDVTEPIRYSGDPGETLYDRQIADAQHPLSRSAWNGRKPHEYLPGKGLSPELHHVSETGEALQEEIERPDHMPHHKLAQAKEDKEIRRAIHGDTHGHRGRMQKQQGKTNPKS